MAKDSPITIRIGCDNSEAMKAIQEVSDAVLELRASMAMCGLGKRTIRRRIARIFRRVAAWLEGIA